MSTLKYISEKTQEPPSQLIEELEPAWSWWEPRPGSGLDEKGKPITGRQPKDIHPLLHRGKPVIPEGMAVEELRLFWPDASLHWISDRGQGSRLFCWTLEEKGSPLSAISGNWLNVAGVEEDKQPVLSLDTNELTRYGLNGTHSGLPARLHLLTVSKAGRVWGWTIGEQAK